MLPSTFVRRRVQCAVSGRPTVASPRLYGRTEDRRHCDGQRSELWRFMGRGRPDVRSKCAKFESSPKKERSRLGAARSSGVPAPTLALEPTEGVRRLGWHRRTAPRPSSSRNTRGSRSHFPFVRSHIARCGACAELPPAPPKASAKGRHPPPFATQDANRDVASCSMQGPFEPVAIHSRSWGDENKLQHSAASLGLCVASSMASLVRDSPSRLRAQGEGQFEEHLRLLPHRATLALLRRGDPAVYDELTRDRNEVAVAELRMVAKPSCPYRP